MNLIDEIESIMQGRPKKVKRERSRRAAFVSNHTKSLRMRYENFQYWARHVHFYPYFYRWSVVIISVLLLVYVAVWGAR